MLVYASTKIYSLLKNSFIYQKQTNKKKYVYN